MGDETSLLDQTKSARNALATLATFAMSLGAKELFHTNFLGFLLESQDGRLKDLQLALRELLKIPLQAGEVSYCAVWREKYNLDLIIIPLVEDRDGVSLSATRCAVIEVKLKSVPTSLQLEGYLGKTLKLPYPYPDSATKGCFCLPLDTTELSKPVEYNGAPTPKNTAKCVLLVPEGIKEIHPQWRNVTWNALQEKMVQHIAKLDTEKGLRPILEDYAAGLQNVLSIVNATRQRQRYLLGSASSYKLFHEEIGHADFRALRLHDLIGKVAFDEWSLRLHKDLGEKMTCSDKKAIYKQIKHFVFFSNGKAGLSFEAPYGKLLIGIQIQGNQLRRYVSSEKERPALENEVINSLLWEDWLNKTVCGLKLTGVKGDPKEPRLSNLRAFNAKKFLYTAISLDTLNIKVIHDEILSSMSDIPIIA